MHLRLGNLYRLGNPSKANTARWQSTREITICSQPPNLPNLDNLAYKSLSNTSLEQFPLINTDAVSMDFNVQIKYDGDNTYGAKFYRVPLVKDEDHPPKFLDFVFVNY